MEAETNRWLSEGAWHTRMVNGWLRKLPVVEIFDVSAAGIIALVNFKALDEQIWVRISCIQIWKWWANSHQSNKSTKYRFVKSLYCSLSLGRTGDGSLPALPSIRQSRQQGGVVFTPLGPAVKGGWGVSRYLAELPVSVCGCVTFITNLITALMVTVWPHRLTIVPGTAHIQLRESKILKCNK